MAKVCRKHKISFNGLRCPKCSAPPVLPDADAPDEELPFPTAEESDEECGDSPDSER